MEINWFTVIAQIINFLILVWLLKRFLYQPVLDAIDKREKMIAAQVLEAETKNANAQKEHLKYQKKNELFEKERTVNMNKVTEELKLEKERLFDEVKEESYELRTKFEESIKKQALEITASLKQKTTNEVFAIANKTLIDLADSNLEEKIMDIFILKIGKMNEEEKEKFKQALNTNDKSLNIKTAFDLSDSSKELLKSTLEEINGQTIKFHYHSGPDLISGIELTAESYQLSWNIESYLDSLKNNLLTNKKEHAS